MLPTRGAVQLAHARQGPIPEKPTCRVGVDLLACHTGAVARAVGLAVGVLYDEAHVAVVANRVPVWGGGLRAPDAPFSLAAGCIPISRG